MKTMTYLMLGVAAASLTMPARAFDGNTVQPTPAQAALTAAQTAHTNASNDVAAKTQAETEARARFDGLSAQATTDENKAAHEAELKTAKTALTAATKALKSAQSAEQKALKAVSKAQEKATAESEKLAKKQAADAEKAEKARLAEEAKNASKQPTQNEITRPKPDSQTGKAWAIFDSVSEKNGSPASIGESLPLATAQGINEATCRTQYARWRKFHGLSGRIEAPKAPEVPAAPEAPVPPVPEAPQA